MCQFMTQLVCMLGPASRLTLFCISPFAAAGIYKEALPACSGVVQSLAADIADALGACQPSSSALFALQESLATPESSPAFVGCLTAIL